MTTAGWKDLGVVCLATGHPVNPNDPSLHWETTGWTQRRRSGMRGAKGGIHGLARPVFSGRVICDTHWKSGKFSGIDAQESFL